MSFLDQFSEQHRDLFQSAGTPLSLARGKYLVRRNEPGGDVYLLQSGSLEVVDTRSTPEVILALMEPGAVVGELAFVDDSPRSADVRAAEEAELTVWPGEDLRRLLARHEGLAAAFYKALAAVAARRMRRVTTTAMAGALGNRGAVTSAGLARVKEESRAVAELVKEGFVDAEIRLRQNSTDKMAQQEVRNILNKLQGEVRTLFMAHPEPAAATEAARVLGRELNPYLVRSSLAERCIRRPQGRSATEEIMAHVMVNSAGGDAQMGELLDRWLLDRPTLRALRSFREPIVDRLLTSLPQHRNRRILLVNAGTGSLVAGLVQGLGDKPTVLTVLDQSRDALAFLDAAMGSQSVTLAAVQQNIVRFALGTGRAEISEQDVFIINGLIEYMPDRIVVSMLMNCRAKLSDGGQVIVPALAPSPDADLLDRVLRWPTIRRTPTHLGRLFEAAKITVAWRATLDEPALLFAGVVQGG